ncbi:MAG TPA: DUF3482 domain-containing protein [Burkholderiales bacterium]|nr:DUF3482 domain-containing protein [Burkholderiales bacterium]
MPLPANATVTLSLVSHTNVGKTTLMRTLIRSDVGEVADRAHVTSSAEDRVLIDTPEGDVLRLWDTPGFGDSVRLLKRLRMSANPIGWFMTQVWDRFTDRPFFNSQIAIRSVREQSDAVLYLVNAAEDPASAGYVDVELEILSWIGKPVLLLLNQMGAPRPHPAEASDEAAWRRQIAAREGVRGPIAMDAFARCWVQEDKLLDSVGAMLPPEKQPAFGRIRATWRERNLKVFDESMLALAAQIAAAATDRETSAAPGFALKARRWVASLVSDKKRPAPETEQAMSVLAQRLSVAVRDATDRLIALHGLSGRAEKVILARLAGDSDVLKAPSDVGTSGVLGGLLTGAAGGLAADLAAGGLTLGAGALIGGLVGALGGAGAAHTYNLARDADHAQVGWSREFLTQRFRAALLRYLAVAHYGRGRGDWVEGEYPPHWQDVVDEVTLRFRNDIEAVWVSAAGGADAGETTRRLQPLMTQAAREALVRLYPTSEEIFAQAVG